MAIYWLFSKLRRPPSWICYSLCILKPPTKSSLLICSGLCHCAKCDWNRSSMNNIQVLIQCVFRLKTLILLFTSPKCGFGSTESRDATGRAARALDLRSTGRGFKSYSGQKLRSDLGQVVHTYVPLSPSSITWYRPRSGDALRLGR